MLNLTKTTPSGRFTVTIESNPPEDDVLLNTDAARYLRELSDLLAEASVTALRLAVRVLEDTSLAAKEPQ